MNHDSEIALCKYNPIRKAALQSKNFKTNSSTSSNWSHNTTIFVGNHEAFGGPRNHELHTGDGLANKVETASRYKTLQ
eukprot:1932362-Rhodomonas_salina.3